MSHPPSLPLAPLGPIGLLLLLASCGPAVGVLLILGLLRPLGPFLRLHAHLGPAVFVAVATLLTGLALMPTYVLCLLAGWAFGVVWGSAVTLTALTAAAALAAGVTRGIAGQRIVALIDSKPRPRPSAGRCSAPGPGARWPW